MLWHFCAFTGRQINQRHSSFFVIQEKTGFLKWSSLMWGMISKLQSQDGLRSTKAHPPSHKYVGRYVYTSCNHTDTPELPNWMRNDSRWLWNWTPLAETWRRESLETHLSYYKLLVCVTCKEKLLPPSVQSYDRWLARSVMHRSDQTGGFISSELVSSSSST